MDINSIRYFLAAAEHLNFTKAAQYCYITQTAMSSSIAKMEKELGVTLFIRSNKKVELTKAGEVFYKQAREIIEAYNNTIYRVQDVEKSFTKQLTVIFPDFSNADLFAPIIHDFRKNNPEATVDPVIMKLKYFPSYILQNNNAIAVGWPIDKLLTSEFENAIVSTYSERVLMGKYHPLAEHESISPEEIHEETCAYLSPEIFPEKHKQELKIWKKYGITPAGIEYHETMEDLFMALLFKNQISIDLPFYSKTASNGIISKPISSEKPILMPLRIYYKKGYMTPLIQQFIEKARAML